MSKFDKIELYVKYNSFYEITGTRHHGGNISRRDPMDFSIQLSAYYPDKAYGGDQVYADMLEQAVLADRTGFDAVSLTEHHLINILMLPAPLQFAVKIAGHT